MRLIEKQCFEFIRRFSELDREPNPASRVALRAQLFEDIRRHTALNPHIYATNAAETRCSSTSMDSPSISAI